jgi:hypothetical protein
VSLARLLSAATALLEMHIAAIAESERTSWLVADHIMLALEPKIIEGSAFDFNEQRDRSVMAVKAMETTTTAGKSPGKKPLATERRPYSGFSQYSRGRDDRRDSYRRPDYTRRARSRSRSRDRGSGSRDSYRKSRY